MKRSHLPWLICLALSGGAAAACPGWQEGEHYAAGSAVRYQEQTYTATVAHTAHVGAGWNPASTPTLWRVGGSCDAAATPTPAATPTAVPVTPSVTPAPGNTACGEAWTQSAVYLGGQRVVRNGVLYQAKWWTQGDDPAQSGAWGVWTKVDHCSVVTPTPQPTPTPTPLPTPTVTPTPAGVLAQIVSGGRVQPESAERVAFGWPGVYFEGRFSGTGVGLRLDDGTNHYNVEIDGKPFARLARPGNTTYWVKGLNDGVHTVRLSKRTEFPGVVARFGGLVAADGGTLLAPPPAPTRRIEFIGDSYTSGLGAESGNRDCSDELLVSSTNSDASFGALTARHYGAAYQLNGYSGVGLVRNYNGADRGTDYRTYYDRALPGVVGNQWVQGDWKPQVVVVGLGINDFSTPVNAGEPYTAETLKATYKAAYLEFLGKLRRQYGNDAYLIVSATALYQTTALADTAQAVVAEAQAQGDARVVYFYYDGLDGMGCQWHPSVNDHRAISGKLINLIDSLKVWP
ncbi:carbohydrate-binding protein [Chitiniphilus shinanonensis]|uniref:carbohydrate-binding protein n=1 Tax=Chitiniphilus shinanonensis TaxID=553088 RepID=UPI003075450C